MKMVAKKLKEYKFCLEEERYFDAHEVLESVWFAHRFEESDEVKLLKGLINAAVSFELYRQNRLPQSKKVWVNYLKYRQKIFKIDSKYLNEYYKLTRFVEEIHKNLLKKS